VGAPAFSPERRSHRNSCSARKRSFAILADATELLQQEKINPNVFRYLSAAKRYTRQASRVLFYDVWHPVWFALLNLTRPLRRSLRHSPRR